MVLMIELENNKTFGKNGLPKIWSIQHHETNQCHGIG
jgi:hypothetical protein